MEEQNRLRQEISEEMLELKEFRDEMREETRYEDGEISKSQAELNEEMYVFMAEFKEEFAQFRAQNDEQMADIRSKLHTIKDLLHDMMKGVGLEPPLDRVNSNPDDPIGDVAACNEKSEPNVQNVETFNSTTPITGILAASTYTTRFEETTDDIAVDGKKNATGSEVCSDVYSVIDELTESSSAVLLKGPVMEPFARYLFDETPKLFPADSDGGVYEKISLSKTEALEIGHHLIDEMPELTSADQNKRVDAHEELILPIVVFPRDLSYGSEVTMVSSFNFSSKSNLEEEFMFVDLKNHMFGADCWVDGILMFIFDPGGGFSPQMDSDVLKNDNELVKMGRETNEKNRGNFIAIVETSVNKNNVWKVLENAFTYEENLIGANGYLEYELLVDAQLDCILVFHFVEIVINWKTSNVGFVDKVGKEWTGMALWYWFGNYLKIMVVGDHCVTPNNSAIMFLLEISISGIPTVGLVTWQPNEVEYLIKSLETIEGVCERICLSRYQMIVFDHGGCRKLAWLWIERVISLLYDLSHVDYLVMCLGSHILKYIGRTSSVDEMKRGVHFAAAIAVMISSSESKSGQHISATHQIQQAYNIVVETSSNVGAETTFFFTMVTVLYLTTGTNDYIHFYQHNVSTVQFSRGTWSFNQSLAQTMKQKFKDLYIADVKRVVAMGFSHINGALYYSLWQYCGQNWECIDVINGIILEINVALRYRADGLNEEPKGRVLLVQSEMEIDDCPFIVDVDGCMMQSEQYSEWLAEVTRHAEETTCKFSKHNNGVRNGSTGGKNQNRSRNQGSGTEAFDLRTLLINCAQSIAADDRQTAYEQLKQIRQHSSSKGDSCQRLASVFANGLEARLDGNGIHNQAASIHRHLSASDKLKAFQVYLSACPFKKISIFFANKMILQAASKATTLHIVDFGILYGFQWPILIQQLSNLPGGPPKLRITGIEHPQPGFRPAELIEQTGRRLAKYCERFHVPFEYQAIANQNWETITIEDIKIVEGEVLAVNNMHRFKNLPDETIMVDNPRDAVLKLIKKMNPDIFVHSIENGGYNAPFFMTRFREALFYYSSLFDMFDATLPREDEHRLIFEQEFYGRYLMDVISCEGAQRVERPETYKQWQVRLIRAGFKPLPLNKEIIDKLRGKVKAGYHKDFDFDEDGSWMLQGWKGRIICASSCWVPALP